MSINWPVVAAVLTSISLLVSGVVGAIVSSVLRRPIDKTNIASMNTESAVKLMQEWRAAYARQEAHHREETEVWRAAYQKQEQNHADVKAVLRLLICAVDKTVPLLQQLVDNDHDPLVDELRSTLKNARSALW